MGPGLSLQTALENRAEIVGTVICGDNTVAENLDQMVPQILEKIKAFSPDLFFAGPAFNAGRYGVACGAICAAVKKELGIPAVTAMYQENPGVELYRSDLYILKAADNARTMAQETQKMANFAFALLDNQVEGFPDQEGFYERGWMKLISSDKPASQRGVQMLLDKLNHRPFHTEIPLPHKDQVEKPAPVKDLRQITVAFATDGGLYPAGNPDKMPPANSTTFHAYSVQGQDTLKKEDYTIVHNGFDKTFLLQDPNRIVPLDAMRTLEREGAVHMHPEFLSTTGLTTNVISSQKIGRGMAQYCREHNIDAVILTST